MTLIIGLTGGIASGKSTVSSMFNDFNIPVIDADQIARDVVRPGEEAYEKIIAQFGSNIVRPDRTLDRKKLGSIVFADNKRRQQLNNIVHPAIRQKMLQQRDEYVRDGKSSVVLDIPLLFESKLMHYVDKIIVVYVDENIQLKRLIDRDKLTDQEAKQRINSQLPLKEKVEQADATIDNNGTIKQTAAQLKEILTSWSVKV
ncbi:MAG TPA: dephospho-CoA kinase [Virgibacillus sp.]|nr:dephospho-CoA kinase [Virgibacillus sp.]